MRVNMFIDQKEVTTNDYADVKDPGKLTEVVGFVSIGDSNHVDQAVKSAHRAFLKWRNVSLDDRVLLLLNAAKKIETEMSAIAKLTARENGMLFNRTMDEIKLGLLDLKEMTKLAYEAFHTVSVDDESGWVRVEKKPLGVIACIVPWNAPLILTLQKITPILLSGNTVVVKPSPNASIGVTKLLKIIATILPAGVINIVFGDGEVGDALTAHPLVRKISFTGGGPVAKSIMKSAATGLKKVHFELGGNDPAIVLDDANVDEVTLKIVEAAFRRTGQFCFAIKRVYVPASMYDRFYEKACEVTSAYRIGYQLNDETTMGPINNLQQFEKIHQLVHDLQNSGANIVKLGRRMEPDHWHNGYYIQPTIVRDIAPYAEIVTCEQFGPILPIVPYQTEEEVIHMANATEYGLGSSIWSSDSEHALMMAGNIEAGMTFINGHGQTMLASKFMPFGGVKQSGIGIEKSIHVFNEFTDFHGINYHQS